MRILLLFLLTLIVQICRAQPAVDAIQIIAKSKKDGIWIRWAPVNQSVWNLGNKYGYVLERFTVKPDGELESQQGIELSDEPIKPLSSADMLKLSATVKEAEVLHELIYGTKEEPGYADNFANVLAKKEDLENRFGIALLICDLSVKAAQSAALFALDSTAVNGQRYIYRVKLAQQKELDVKPGVIVVDVTDEQPLLTINDLQADFRDHTVTLSWSTLMHQGVYSFYYIEKSSDGNNFKRVSDMPYAHMTQSPETETAFFIDSLDVNAKTYYYRISGVTPFGETGPVSNVVKGEGKNTLAGLLIIREGKIVEEQAGEKPKIKTKKDKNSHDSKTHKINLVWEFPAEEEKQISGFIIARAARAEGPYIDINTPVLAGGIRSYTDMTSFHNTYYQIRAVDKLKNEMAHSYPFLVQVEDNTPPQIPKKPTGSLDSAGVASLSWEPGIETDIMGYRVFKMNSLREEPVEITKEILTKNEYSDTVNTNVLNKNVYYSIVAVDKNYNASDYSTPIKLAIPDKLAPAAPVITGSEVIRDTIILHWENSASDDVKKYELIRLEKNKPEKLVLTWTPVASKNVFSEHTIEPGKAYQYKMTVTDSAGNSTSVFTREILFEPGFRPAVTDLRANVNRDARSIAIKWKAGLVATKCLVYRKINNGKLSLYKTVEGDVKTFEDKNIQINNSYTYKVQLVHANNIRSLISTEVRVVY